MSLLAVYCLLWQPQTHIRFPTCHVTTGSCTYQMLPTLCSTHIQNHVRPPYCHVATGSPLSVVVTSNSLKAPHLPCRYWQLHIPDAAHTVLPIAITVSGPPYCHVATGCPTHLCGNLAPQAHSLPRRYRQLHMSVFAAGRFPTPVSPTYCHVATGNAPV